MPPTTREARGGCSRVSVPPVSVTGFSTVTRPRTAINHGSAQEPTRCLLIKTASWCFCLPGQGATRQGPQQGTAGRATRPHARTPPSCSGGGRHAGRGWQLSEGPGTQAASGQGTGAHRVAGLPRTLSVGLAHSRAIPGAHVTAAHELLRKTHTSEGSVANAPRPHSRGSRCDRDLLKPPAPPPSALL